MAGLAVIISSRTSTKLSTWHPRFAMTTTSAPRGNRSVRKRNTSRTIRFILLRRTALPTWRVTVMPSLGPQPGSLCATSTRKLRVCTRLPFWLARRNWYRLRKRRHAGRRCVRPPVVEPAAPCTTLSARLLLVDRDGQAAAALAATVLDDATARGSLHALTEAVGAKATGAGGLVGALHGFLRQSGI